MDAGRFDDDGAARNFEKIVMETQILETWEINNRVNLYVLDAIAPEFLSDISASKGRSVGEQFAHLHNVRLMWLKQAAPDVFETQTKIEKAQAADKEFIRFALENSNEGIKQLFQNSLSNGGKIKGFKPHATAFLGYLIAHESHHRSQIILSLKQAGHHLDRKTLFGIWEWGVR
jgi:uncharacterized damage-inducible protein DinB